MTYEKFKQLPYDQAFRQGETTDDADGANMQNTGQQLRWVAKKGRIDDWCIYVGTVLWSWETILSNGDKICSKTTIQRLVPCDDAMFNAYRF